MKEFTEFAMRAVREMGEVARPGWLLVGSLMIWGCESGTSTGPAAVTFSPAQPSGRGFTALYAPPPYHVVPYPNDIYNPVAAGLGATLNVPTSVVRPLAAAVNTLDGFSTVAKVTAPFNAPIEAATLVGFNPAAPAGNETVFVLDATRGVPLVPGVDYSVGVSTAAGTGGSLLEITPLRPLAPKTTYVFVLTSGIRSTLDVPASADQAFGAVRDAHLGRSGQRPRRAGTRCAVPRHRAAHRRGGGAVEHPRRLRRRRLERPPRSRFPKCCSPCGPAPRPCRTGWCPWASPPRIWAWACPVPPHCTPAGCRCLTSVTVPMSWAASG